MSDLDLNLESVVFDDYGKFKKVVGSEENVADAYVKLEDKLDSYIEVIKNKRSELGSVGKKAKAYRELNREFLVQYLEETNSKKLEGNSCKSINYQPQKTVVETVAMRQIKIGGRFKNLDDVSRETLIEMLEELGVKTREVAEKVEITTPASVRILR